MTGSAARSGSQGGSIPAAPAPGASHGTHAPKPPRQRPRKLAGPTATTTDPAPGPLQGGRGGANAGAVKVRKRKRGVKQQQQQAPAPSRNAYISACMKEVASAGAGGEWH